MRSNREHMILAVVFATAVGSSQAAAETAPCQPACGEGQTCVNGACAPAAGKAAPAPTEPTPGLAAPGPRRSGQAATWREGFMLLPSVGINSFQGDSGQNLGVGLRAGLLAGSRMGENWSLNVGFAYDRVSIDAPDTSRFVVDTGLNPLIHFPLEKLEIVAGPVMGVFLDKGSAGSGAFASDTWAYGYTIGANAGLFFPVGSRVRLGGLLNFFLRSPLKVCVTQGGMDDCVSSGLPSIKTLGVSLAALF